MSTDIPMPNMDSSGNDQDLLPGHFQPEENAQPAEQSQLAGQSQPAERPQEIISSVREVNTTQGSEFLDDAIRIKDQPYTYKTTRSRKIDHRSFL